MTETNDRLWKKPQNVKNYAKSVTTTKKSNPNSLELHADIWAELKNHPSWNNLFALLENYINCCTKLEKKVHSEKHYVVKKVSIRKKYKKYKKRYKLFKNETSLQASDNSYEYVQCFK